MTISFKTLVTGYRVSTRTVKTPVNSLQFRSCCFNGHQLLLQLSWSWDTWLLSLGVVVVEAGLKAAAKGNLLWHFFIYSSNWASQLPKSPFLNASITSTQFCGQNTQEMSNKVYNNALLKLLLKGQDRILLAGKIISHSEVIYVAVEFPIT